ncbi:MAG: squalene--hopene cyclase [Actinomycetota bacterium]|nr:squalene--hopene cyclase [Actinomycetota bacterium]
MSPLEGSLSGVWTPGARAGTPTPGAASGGAAPTGARGALARAVDALVAMQEPAGYWKAELETNVTMDAEDLLLRQFLGIRGDKETEGTATWIRANQREDGTWATFFGGPPDLSTTIEAYVALRLAGDPRDAAHLRSARQFILDAGGIEASRVFTRIWLALFGLWRWDDLPVLPPELMFFPPWMPLNIYDFGAWARQTVVALTVVGSYRPVRPIPLSVDELRTGAPSPAPHPVTTWPGVFERLDRVLHRYERHPIGPLRRAALTRAEAWIVARQEAYGSWGGIQPPWVYSLMALELRGYPLDHPVMAAGLAGLDRFTIWDDKGRRLEACQSPVWDTVLSMLALEDAGMSVESEVLERAGRWVIGEEVTLRGDWSIRRPDLAPGGWAFEFANDNYPDVDDTAVALLALNPLTLDDGGAIERAVAWVEGMQCRDGGWGAFDVDNTRALCRELPFFDFGELIDPPSADVTAHVVEAFATAGRSPATYERGVRWLLAHQEPDGSWFGRWGVNHVYGTGAVVPALVAAGVPARHPALDRARRWLVDHQNPDGGFGEDIRSYTDPSWRGRGVSTASQTAWALLALVALDPANPSTERAVAWLVDHQEPDGTWDEPQYTGTGFPGDFSINYHLYRLVFPVMALARYCRWAAGGRSGGGRSGAAS